MALPADAAATPGRTLMAVWRGDIGWREATRAGQLAVRGPSSVQRLVPRLLKLSAFAAVQRPSPPSPEPRVLAEVP